MKKLFIIILLFLFVCGCSKVKNELATPQYPSKTSYNKIVGSQYQGLTLDFAFYEALNNFTFQSSKIVLDYSKNQMYSPISLFMALSMLAEGCANETLDEILNALGIDNLELLRTENEKLYKKLYFNNEIGRLFLANSIWLNKDHEFVKKTIDLLAQYYYAQSFALDFKSPTSGKQIGRWIKDNTGGKLGGDDFPIDPGMLVVLINTIYFYDQWQEQFPIERTSTKPFYGDKMDTVPFMVNQVDSLYQEKANYQLAAISFKNNGKMVFILPNEDVAINDIIKSDDFYNIFSLNQAQNQRINLELPKFSFKTTYDLIPALNAMGINKVFNNADLSNILLEAGFVSEVIQESSIVVDENGCEATAYTKIIIDSAAPPEPEIDFILNRPFIFAITCPDGLPLFVGVVKTMSET